MSRESPIDPELARRSGRLAVVVQGLELRTRGLELFGQAEIIAMVEAPEDREGARRLLLRLIGFVVHGGGRLRSGAEIQVGPVRARLERRPDGRLELWQVDGEGRWSAGASLIVRRLAETDG